MPITPAEAREVLLADLNEEQRNAVSAGERRILVIAGAGSGKTEVMARRVAWWVAVEGVAKDQIVAFTFMSEAAEELKFRIRSWLQRVAGDGEHAALGGMFIGTIHGFCLRSLRDFAPADYYMFDILDDAGRVCLLEQGAFNVLGLRAFHSAAEATGAANGKANSYKLFQVGYDQLNEHGILDVQLPDAPPPPDVGQERDWCIQANLTSSVGEGELPEAFADSAARYYAYLRARRFFDYGTVQSELVNRITRDADFRARFEEKWTHLVIDEVQDINPVQDQIVRSIVRDAGHLTAVGDHRQAVYAFRGGRVDLMGAFHSEIELSDDGRVLELPSNYRSTDRIIRIANAWSQTIRDRGGMTNPNMAHGREGRVDTAQDHVALLKFDQREQEAVWIAETIASMVRSEERRGARHDLRTGHRGIGYGDIAILVRSGTDIRTYQNALQNAGIPAVVRGGPDLFSQPESLLLLAAFSLSAGVTNFMGNVDRPGSFPNRIRTTLNVGTTPADVVPAAIAMLRRRGVNVDESAAGRLLTLADAIRRRNVSDRRVQVSVDEVHCTEARRWLGRGGNIRRVFPQRIFHWLLEEAGIATWGDSAPAEAARFHVGQISKLIKGIETSGWTPPDRLKWQLIALLQWGSERARSAAAPLLVAPDAVTITTVHSAKGLEFPAVFIADVNPQRFPSNRARTQQNMPFDLNVVTAVDPARLADNDNYDDERRLLYVALTRAERYLFVSCSGNRRSRFVRQLEPMFTANGGTVSDGPLAIAETLEYSETTPDTDDKLATSFSDLRYFTECPHDFYMRIVMGFTPTIGQEFGYGRGVHNLLRAVHDNPAEWAALAVDSHALTQAVEELIEQGMFYLRYTTGDPLHNLKRKAVEGVTEYVMRYAGELAELEFEPEKEFETLIGEEQLLISGAIDVVRMDDPPRVTIVDFKSGDREGESGSGLTREMMAMQIGVYGLAAVHELEFEPQSGLIRYIGERDPSRVQVEVDLTGDQLNAVRQQLIRVAHGIRNRQFDTGPTHQNPNRCTQCDFRTICKRSNDRD